MPRLAPLRRLLLAALVLTLLAPTAASADGDGSRWTWPLGRGGIERDFVAPASEYGAGHRGVDLPGTPGETVRAVATGTVAFVGDVAGTPVVTVSHGRERSTYQPVHAEVAVGNAVSAGQPIGTLAAGHNGCGSPACLHLGRVEGEAYLDPTELLGGAYRLMDPDGELPRPPSLGSGELVLPVAGPVTSAYGTRRHPVTGVVKLHDGIDLGAPCGTDVRAAAPGVVTAAGVDGPWGGRVVLEHGPGEATSYSHLQRIGARVGQRLAAGDVLGTVGSTGLSTGCHLHFSVHRGGTTIDPAPLL